MAADVTHADTLEVIHRLGQAAERIVLVGGQALNFWAEYFSPSTPELASGGPYTSKDIDFMGSRAQVQACATALGVRPLFPKPGDTTPSTGKVIYFDSSQQQREIDFLSAPFGLSGAEIQELSIPVEATTPFGAVVVHALHPVHCLQSRVSNTAGLPGYSTPHALGQLRSSITCVRAFLLNVLTSGETRTVLKLNEKLFKFCFDSRYARDVATKHGIEPFGAVLNDPRLPATFQNVRFPQMQSNRLEARKSQSCCRTTC